MRGVGGFRGLKFSIYVLDFQLLLRGVGGFSIYILDFQLLLRGVGGFSIYVLDL